MKTLFLLLLSFNAHAAGKIVNADIAASGTANIALNKLAASTAHNACTFDNSGFIAGGVAPGASGNILKSNGTDWVSSTESDPNAWALLGNSGTTAGTNFLGTTDAKDLVFKTNATENARIANATGYLGVGTNNPQALVHSSGSSAALPVLTMQNTASAGHGRYDINIDNSGFWYMAQNGAGFYALTIDNSGDKLAIGNFGALNSSTFGINASAEDNTVLTVRGFASGVQDLQDWQTGTPTTVAHVDSAGKFWVPALNDSALSVSQAVVTDGSKNLASLAYGTASSASSLVERDASQNIAASGTATLGQVIDSGLSASTVPYADASKQLTSSAVTPTELGYVSGVTSSIQTQLNAKASSTLTSAHLFVGNVSNVATDVAASGDVSLANTGAFTVAKVDGVTYPASPATGTVPNVTGANTVAYTATPTLGVATSVKGTLSFAGNTSGTVTVQPAAAAGTWSLTLPTTGGTANYFMQTNGSGVSTWAQAVTPDGNVPFAGNESIGGANAFTRSVANAGTTGTTNNKLAKLTGAPSTAVITATTDTGGAIGVVTAFGGTTGSAEIAMSGTVACTFDGATTAGDYVQISGSTAGDCHDAGATYPTSGQVVGRVLSTNGSGGAYNILIFPAEMQTGGGTAANVVTSSSNSERIERARVASTCSGSPCTLTSSTSGFSSITRTGTGAYTLNFVGGTFSAAPTCVATFENFAGWLLWDTTQTATAMPLVTRNTSNTNTDSAFQIICEGPH